MRHIKQLIVTFACFSSLLMGCGRQSPPQPPAGGSGELVPVKIAVIQDIVGPHTVPPVQRMRADDLSALIALLESRGGELAVGVVDSSDPPLIRLQMKAAPPAPGKTGNVLKDNQNSDQYKGTLKGWTQQTNASIAAFKEQLTPLLARSSPGDPDIWPTVERADAFLQESDRGWSAPPQKWLLVASDRERVTRACRDIYGNRTVPPGSEIIDSQFGARYRCMPEGDWSAAAASEPVSRTAVVPLASPTPPVDVLPISADVQVVAVKAAPGEGPVDDRHPVRFGDLKDAIRYITAS